MKIQPLKVIGQPLSDKNRPILLLLFHEGVKTVNFSKMDLKERALLGISVTRLLCMVIGRVVFCFIQMDKLWWTAIPGLSLLIIYPYKGPALVSSDQIQRSTVK